MFYLHVVLANIGDIQTEIVTKAHEKMTVFLALMLHLLDYTYRTFQGTAENTDGVVLLDEVAVSFVYDAQSFNAFGYLVTEIHETFHIIIRNPRLFHDIIQCSGLTVGTKDMRLSKKGSLYDIITSRSIINTLIHEVAVLGKESFQTPFTLHSDKEQSLQDGCEAYFFLTLFVRVSPSSHGKVVVNNCIVKFFTQQIH